MPAFPMLLILAAAAASPALPPQAKSVVGPTAQPAATKIIAGFRSARFRMTPTDVRRAIAADFPGVAIVERTQPNEGTTVFQISVDLLDPGPGAATISYVFGATAHTLAQVSVIWATKGDATDEERQAIAVAGLRLSKYFGREPQARTVLPPTVLRPGTVNLYGAVDTNGAAIDLIASGIAYSSTLGPAPPPTGPAVLRLSYMANPANPDLRHDLVSAR